MTERREFLSALTVGLGSALGGRPYRRLSGTAPRVEALSTVFYSSPDGANSLIRFTIHGLDAPAGRLRIYDRRRKLVGTAGVINTGEALYGELWLALDRSTTITSELEAPGLRGVHRTRHLLKPAPRWTLHWLVIADPSRIEAAVGLAPLTKQVRAAILRASGVHANPLVAGPPSQSHVEFLQMATQAQLLEQSLGVPMSPIANHRDPVPLAAPTVTALTGSGIRYVIRPWQEGSAYEWWEGLDNSRLLAIPVADGGDGTSLGFADSPAEMARRVEKWLSESPLNLAPAGRNDGPGGDRVTYVLDSTFDGSTIRMAGRVDEWNRRYAYPKIVIGIQPDPTELVTGPSSTALPVRRRSFSPSAGMGAGMRVRSRLQGADQAAVLATVLANGRRGLAAIASEIQTDFSGTLIFNPSPFVRTDIVTIDDRQRLVTDIPGNGYAFIIDVPDARVAAATPTLTPTSNPVVDGERLRLTLDERSGAIVSLVNKETGEEWVDPGGDGLNAVTDARVEGMSRQSLPGVGTRLVVTRRVPGGGMIETVTTVPDVLPWIEVRNSQHGGDPRRSLVEYRFKFAVSDPEIFWEVPGGHMHARGPVNFDYLRWVHLRGHSNAFLAATAASSARVEQDGTFVEAASQDPITYRLAVDSLPATVAVAARFGLRAEPLQTLPVESNPSGRLPRYGSLFLLDQPSAAIIAIQPENRHASEITVYVQDLLGTGRMLELAGELLTFDEMQIVDYLGREIGAAVTPAANDVSFPVRPYGVTAIRLGGVRLRDGVRGGDL